MELEVSLPYSQEPAATGPYSEPHESIQNFPKIHSNIVVPSTPRSSEWSFPSGFPTCLIFRNRIVFYDVELLARITTPNLEDYPFSAVCNRLFIIFAATLHNFRPSPSSATRESVMQWWHGST